MMQIFDDILVIKNGKSQKSVESPDGKYPIYGSGGVMGYANQYICEADTVVVGRKGSINNPLFVQEPFWNVDTAFGLCANREVLLPRYLYYFCKHFDFERLNKAVTIPSLTKSDLLKIEIDLPAIDEQESIARKLNAVESIIDLRRQQLAELDNLVKARFVEIFGDPESNNKRWLEATISELCSVGSSKRILQSEQCNYGVPFLRVSDLVKRMDTGELFADLYIPEERYADLCSKGQVPIAGDILITSRGTLGRCYIWRDEDVFYFQDGMISWLSNFSEIVTPIYIYHLFSMPGFRKQIDSFQAGSTVAYLSIAMIKQLIVMLPPIALQNKFAAFVEQVDKSKVAIQKALDEAQLLFDSLMQEYFG